jgi:hypothetical protein
MLCPNMMKQILRVAIVFKRHSRQVYQQTFCFVMQRILETTIELR